MPKGVYDRTKTKEQRDAEKKGSAKTTVAKTAPKAKTAVVAKKATPAPVAKKVTESKPVVTAAPVPALSAETRRNIVVDNLDILMNLRNGLNIVEDVASETSKLINSEILENLKLFSGFRTEIFGVEAVAEVPIVATTEEPVAEEETDGNGASTAPAIPPVTTGAWQPPPPAAQS